MRDNYQELGPKILRLFRQGYDTVTIAKGLKMREEDVERMLHSAMAIERFKGQRMSILTTHHIEFVEDRKRKEYWAICTCGWEESFDGLMEAHMAAAKHDLDIWEEEEDDNS